MILTTAATTEIGRNVRVLTAGEPTQAISRWSQEFRPCQYIPNDQRVSCAELRIATQKRAATVPSFSNTGGFGIRSYVQLELQVFAYTFARLWVSAHDLAICIEQTRTYCGQFT